MRTFKNAWFRKFARKQNIGDQALCDAIGRAEAGVIDANLGGGLIKQRVARKGAGRSGGYRTLVAFKAASRSVFIFGFAKSDQDNIDDAEERELKKLAKLVLGLSDEEMDRLVAAGTFDEVRCGDPKRRENVPKRNRRGRP